MTRKRAKTLHGPVRGPGVASVFRGVRHLRTIAPAAALAVWLAGCASLGISDPDNQPITGSAEEAFASSRTDPTAGDDVLVGLAFSGGGTRAAAFAHGVLQEIDQTTVRTRTGTHSLLDSVGFVSGVSGGSVTAAYYGLKKRAALADFREKFLIRNAEAGPQHQRRSAQPGEGARRRRQRRQDVLALARREPVRRRDLRGLPQDAGPAGLDQRLRHLQPHALHLRRGDLHRAVQQSRDLSDRGRGRGLGRGADRVHARW